MAESEETRQEIKDIERIAEDRARIRASDARWNLDIAIFAFAILILVVILGFQRVGLEIVVPIAVVGLSLVWLLGWYQGKKVFTQFYNEEIFTLMRENREKDPDHKPVENYIEEMVQKAIRDRFK